MGFRVAVVGATGNVGRELLTTLAERDFPADDVAAIASERSVGQIVSYGEDDELKVADLNQFDFKGTDIVLSSPGAKVSAVHAPRAAKAGAIVIDNTSHFRMDPDVPLVVPEVNGDRIADYGKAQHHRQSKLFDDPDGRRVEAAARSCHHPARIGCDLSIRFRRRQIRDERAVQSNPRHLRE